MSVTISTTQQSPTFWQRLTGSEPRTTVHVTTEPERSFSLKAAVRNGGIGAAVAGALGGVSLLGKVALPLIGQVGSVSGLLRLAGVGGAIGVASAALPLLVPSIRRSPAAKAAVTGAAIGAAAGAFLPFLPIPLGAAIGAGVGLLVHHRRNRPHHDYPRYPGYEAHPGYHPMGVGPGTPPPGLVPVTPNYGSYAGSAMNPYGNLSGYGMPHAGFGMPVGHPMPMPMHGGYGMSLPMQGVGAQGLAPQMVPQGGVQPAVQPAVQPTAQPAAATSRPTTARSPKFRGARTFTDKAGNVRQVGSGRVVRPAAGGVRPVPSGTAAPLGMQPTAGMALPFSGGSPYGAQAAAYGAMPQAASSHPVYGTAAIPARPV